MAFITTINDKMIQIAQLNDLDKIITIEQRTNPFPWTEGQLQDSLQRHDVFIFKQGGNKDGKDEQTQIIAFLIAQNVVDEASLLHIVVDTVYQSKGVGRQMLTDWLQQLPNNIAKIWLEVRESNQSAQKLYLSCGFKKIGERKNYYRGNLFDASSDMEKAYIYSLSV